VEVDAVDFPLMLGRDQGTLTGVEPGFAALINSPQSIYFTVASASIALVPA
jgi:hypothetical protein